MNAIGRILSVCVAGLVVGSSARGSVSYLGGSYVQSFDNTVNSGLPAGPGDTCFGDSPAGWVDDDPTPASAQVSIVGWYLYHPTLQNTTNFEGGANGHQRLRVTYPQSTATFPPDPLDDPTLPNPPGSTIGTTGSFYSFGNATIIPGVGGNPPVFVPNAERSLGAIPSASLAPNGGEMFYGLRLTNNTPITLTQFTVTYAGEQWRVAKTPTVPNQTVTLDYRLGGAEFQSGTFVELPTGGFESIIDTDPNGIGIDGNLPQNRSAGRGATVSNISWAPGTDLWIRWTHVQNAGTDHGLAIDEVAFTAIPEPAGLAALAVVALSLFRRRHAAR